MLGSQVHSSSLRPHSLISCPWVKSFSVPIISIMLSLPAAKKQKHSFYFVLWFPLWSAVPGHSPAKASLCSWKNNPIGNLHTGFLRSCLFLARVYKILIQQKKTGRTTNSIQCIAPWQTLCHFALTPRHNWPCELHKVIYEDRPCPWGERTTMWQTFPFIVVSRLESNHLPQICIAWHTMSNLR